MFLCKENAFICMYTSQQFLQKYEIVTDNLQLKAYRAKH